jgi:hypothetical protein
MRSISRITMVGTTIRAFRLRLPQMYTSRDHQHRWRLLIQSPRPPLVPPFHHHLRRLCFPDPLLRVPRSHHIRRRRLRRHTSTPDRCHTIRHLQATYRGPLNLQLRRTHHHLRNRNSNISSLWSSINNSRCDHPIPHQKCLPEVQLLPHSADPSSNNNSRCLPRIPHRTCLQLPCKADHNRRNSINNNNKNRCSNSILRRTCLQAPQLLCMLDHSSSSSSSNRCSHRIPQRACLPEVQLL